MVSVEEGETRGVSEAPGESVAFQAEVEGEGEAEAQTETLEEWEEHAEGEGELGGVAVEALSVSGERVDKKMLVEGVTEAVEESDGQALTEGVLDVDAQAL